MFLSADQATADFLAEKHLIVKQCNLLTNRLVVITPANEELELKSLADVADARITRLALAEPAVPAGKYGRQALGNAKVWDRVASKVVGGIDVRATLQFVARREVEAGIVYYTDAVGSSGVRIALEIPQELHEPIIYPLALVERQPKQDAAVRLFEYLQSDKATTMFQQHHFGKAK